VANRADQASLVVQDIARSSLKTLIQQARSGVLAIIRKVDAQTDAVNALGKRREGARKAMRQAKTKKRPT
jgi:hypothetical protein